MTAAKEDAKRPGAPWTTPGTEQPEKRPGPFAQDPSRTPPTREQRERDYEKGKDDKMDDVVRDAPL
jgi:hypothetical protein